jgi:branched-chain amino acid transport system ATP-binding protein
MLQVKNLHVSYGKVQALWGVTMEVPPASIVALVGANGAGKTTLIKTISGLIRATAGRIYFMDRALERASPEEIVRLGIVQVPEGRKLFPEMTVLDNLLMGGYLASHEERQSRLDEVFVHFPRLKERQKQIAGTLSGGEQQMVAIGRGLMAGPKVLMLDEPSLGLAPLLVEEVFEVVSNINRSGVTILLVEQNTYHALTISQNALVMEVGKIVLSGTGKELLNNPEVRKAYMGL